MPVDRIKVCFFIDSFMVGGMHRQVLYLVKHLNKEIFEPFMCTSSPYGGLRGEFEQTGCKLLDLNWKRKFDPPIIYRLIKILEAEKPNIIYITEAHNLYYYQIARIFWHKHVVQIGSIRSFAFWLGHRKKLYHVIDIFLSRWLYISSEHVVVNSLALKDYYSGIINISPKNPLKVIYNGNDFVLPISKQATLVRQELNISLNEIFIIMVARLDPWKDFVTFLNAAKIVVEIDSRAKFYIVGDGELRNNLELMIVGMDLKRNVQILGEKNDIFDYVNASDISVLSTNGEGFSNSLLESMALGKPVIATSVGGNPETIGVTNESGILVSPKSPRLFADAILYLMKNEVIRKKMGQMAKERIHHLCSIEKYVSSYEELFQQSLKKNPFHVSTMVKLLLNLKYIL